MTRSLAENELVLAAGPLAVVFDWAGGAGYPDAGVVMFRGEGGGGGIPTNSGEAA